MNGLPELTAFRIELIDEFCSSCERERERKNEV